MPGAVELWYSRCEIHCKRVRLFVEDAPERRTGVQVVGLPTCHGWIAAVSVLLITN